MSQKYPTTSTSLYDLLKQSAEAKEVNSLTWSNKLGLGFLPPTENYAYNEDYWDVYKRLEGTKICYELNEFRVKLVAEYIGDGELLDVGIVCGTFIKERQAKTYGADVNPMGIAWLKERHLFKGPDTQVENASYWDVCEHIHDLEEEFGRVDDHVFISTPMYTDREQCRSSKHYKPNEHFWYFTQDGMIDFMAYCGFDCLHITDMETVIGRENIKTFVFKRK